jgi:hypothetical protein
MPPLMKFLRVGNFSVNRVKFIGSTMPDCSRRIDATSDKDINFYKLQAE